MRSCFSHFVLYKHIMIWECSEERSKRHRTPDAKNTKRTFKMAIFTNQATLIYNGQSTASNVTTGEILDGITMTKTALVGSYSAGGRVTYAINIVNNGAAVTNATLTDDLGAYDVGGTTVYPLEYIEGSLLFYQNGAVAEAPTVAPGAPLVFSGINIPAGGNAVLVYEAAVTAFAPLAQGSTVTNNATLQTDRTTLTDSATVEVLGDVRLTIAKAICPQTVSDNGTLTYTFIIQNSGNTPVVATDNVIVTDTFNPILNPINVTYNGEGWTEGAQYTYNETTGEFATLEGNITVPAATYTQDPVSGAVLLTPGVAVITVTGTV